MSIDHLKRNTTYISFPACKAISLLPVNMTLHHSLHSENLCMQEISVKNIVCISLEPYHIASQSLYLLHRFYEKKKIFFPQLFPFLPTTTIKVSKIRSSLPTTLHSFNSPTNLLNTAYRTTWNFLYARRTVVRKQLATGTTL